MKKFLTYLPLVFLLFFSVACSDSPDQKLKNKIVHALRNDNTLDENEWQDLVNFVENNSKDYPELLNNGKINAAKLATFIQSNVKANREGVLPTIFHPAQIAQKGAATIETASSGATKIQVFLENSYSMDGYIKGKTSFEAAIGNLLVLLGNYYDKKNLSVSLVNSQIYPVEESSNEMQIEDFLEKLEPNSIEYDKGVRGVTKLNEVIDKTLKRTNENDISVLISDFIYSLDSKKNDTEGALNFEKNLTQDAFLDKFKEHEISTVIVKLQSQFNGTYYDKNDRPILLSNKTRPFYIFVFGKPALIDDLLKKITLTELKGYEARYVLTPHKDQKTPYFTVLKIKNKQGSFDSSRETEEYVRAVENAKFKDGSFQMAVAADLSKISVDESYLLDPKNYKISEDFELVKIEKCERSQFKNQEQGDWRQIEKTHCTHLMTIKAKRNFPSQILSIELLDKMPNWVNATNSDDDKDIKTDPTQENKTFGIKYLVEGVGDSYRELGKMRGQGSDLSHFKMTISLKK